MASREFIERRLRLKVNADKSAVARPEERHFLGFRLRREPLDGEVEVLLSKRSEERIDVEDPRADTAEQRAARFERSFAAQRVLRRMDRSLRDLHGAVIEQRCESDAHIRRRMRALSSSLEAQTTIARRLIRLGIRPKTAWRRVYEGRKSLWALSHAQVVDRALRNAYFAERGLVSLLERFRPHWAAMVAPTQLMLSLEPARS